MTPKEIISNKNFIQFIKFGMVGVTNTLISYGIELLCFYIIFRNATFTFWINFFQRMGIIVSSETFKIVFTSIIAFIISVTNSYILNNRFVFKNGPKTVGQNIVSFFRSLLCYGITGLVLAPIIKILLKNMGIPYYISAFSSLVITVPINFLLNKFWAFALKKDRG